MCLCVCWERQGRCFVSCLDEYSLCRLGFCVTRRCWCLFVPSCKSKHVYAVCVHHRVWKTLPTLASSQGLPSLADLTFFPVVHVRFQDKSLHSLVWLRAQRNDRIPHPRLATSRAIFYPVLVALTLKTTSGTGHFLAVCVCVRYTMSTIIL